MKNLWGFVLAFYLVGCVVIAAAGVALLEPAVYRALRRRLKEIL
jgi:hypothetical protein